ncbi:MAG: phosphotransferase, partial [Pseudomonadota bacterium]
PGETFKPFRPPPASGLCMHPRGDFAKLLHAQARSWRRPEWFERFTWDAATAIGDTPHWGRWRHGIGVDVNRADLFAETADLIAHRLAAYGKSSDRFGLVHCDLRLANILVDGDIVKVIDFDDSGFSWFMYDAATPVSFYEHLPQTPELIRHWIEGYRRVADLSQDDLNEIATFVMLRRLLLVAWIGSHSETDLARSMGLDYTGQTDDLCRTYLKDMG